MKIKILFFGNLTEVIGSNELSLSDIEHTDGLNNNLQYDYPELKAMTYRIAVNQEIINGNISLKDGDEVALLPPFAGG